MGFYSKWVGKPFDRSKLRSDVFDLVLVLKGCCAEIHYGMCCKIIILYTLNGHMLHVNISIKLVKGGKKERKYIVGLEVWSEQKRHMGRSGDTS